MNISSSNYRVEAFPYHVTMVTRLSDNASRNVTPRPDPTALAMMTQAQFDRMCERAFRSGKWE
ncbi:hypothetical protein RCDURKIN_100 [Rhodobacter phage RcDurkin]|nr:hypothetical protein RCDURKIN_100 [Rhodobacter phage RcDurkin]QXN72569.1 hypothetical protein RCTIPTONUS_99 [Rhodobacter phage RcTiptonus]UUV43844.1 hypothetical protein RCKICKAPOO_103 [Rhodobacter phage RcKickapoo]UUV44470.1 hypothetical protein RCMENCHIE_101 [Rhodobacter phage RcMenchie]